ncbi:MAG: DUF4870 domain-containing protein [Liquorilactobacillus hordei]|uniref:DUF4870 domain-containing protein n=1 Tax=Liquorilactobacillus hordei TaxID=468911 RepID=A0A3S6QPH8_9LACO|nr:DUF4870 domain-containing protein [Liquorilactobacillus hordei]AUJ29942.1 hypothetical protein BSQ49_06880 [Liquorilactobacillus hordei]MBZ2404798.1 hypothetical protein [Liquorilactobacillus hordei]
MQKIKILSSLSYLSIVFAPFIFPLIIWFVCADEPIIRNHAKKSFLLHLLPIFLTLVGVIFVGTTGIITEHAQLTSWTAVLTIGIILLVDLIVFIYNIYKGIKILVQD